MTTTRFDGLVKPMRRGDWSARGAIITERHGQLIETMVGPREFVAKDLGVEWLHRAAAERSIDAVRIVVHQDLPGRDR